VRPPKPESKTPIDGLRFDEFMVEIHHKGKECEDLEMEHRRFAASEGIRILNDAPINRYRATLASALSDVIADRSLRTLP
jgi:hypothetical protein